MSLISSASRPSRGRTSAVPGSSSIASRRPDTAHSARGLPRDLCRLRETSQRAVGVRQAGPIADRFESGECCLVTDPCRGQIARLSPLVPRLSRSDSSEGSSVADGGRSISPPRWHRGSVGAGRRSTAVRRRVRRRRCSAAVRRHSTTTSVSGSRFSAGRAAGSPWRRSASQASVVTANPHIHQARPEPLHDCRQVVRSVPTSQSTYA